MVDVIDKYDQTFRDAGEEWDVDPVLLKALAKHELGGDPNIRGKSGEVGLGQFMPDTAKRIGITDRSNPEQSIWGMAKLMNEALVAEKENGPAALRYYNGGAGWRSKKTDPNYPSYVGGQYKKYAARDTGTRTDATPALAKPQTDEEWLDEQAKTYPGLAGPKPDKQEAPVAKTAAAEKDDDPFARALSAPAPKAEEGKPKPDATPAADDPFSRALIAPPPPPSAAAPSLADATASPSPAEIDAAVPDVARRNLLDPPPADFETSSIVPFMPAIRKTQTPGNMGADIRFDIGGLRPLYHGVADLFKMGQGLVVKPATEEDPTTKVDLSEEAKSALGLIAGRGPRDLQFGPRQFVKPGLLDPKAPLSPGFKASPVAPGGLANLLDQEALQADVMNPPGSRPAGPPTAEGQAAAPAPAPRSATGIEPPPPPAALVLPHESDPKWVAGTVDSVREINDANKAAGVPGSVGAMATPAQLATLTPEQMKAYRRQAELGEIIAPPEPGDRRVHVPGSHATEAEYSGDPLISQKETMTRARRPEAFEGEGGRLTENSKARIAHYESEMGSDPQLVDIRERQRKTAETDTAQILKSAQPANLQPLLDHYDALLADPRLAERPDVVKIIKPLRDALFDKDGKLKTDPRAVWGMHDNLMTAMEKAKDPLNASSAEKFAFRQLQDAKGVTDGVMNAATGGGFQTFLDHQRDFFQQINKIELLQKFRTGMVDPKTGHIYGNKFHKWVTDLAVRRGRQGVDAAMDIPDSTMRVLIDIDNDLKRSGNIDLGKARGSPTNLYFELAKALGIAGVHGITGFAGFGGIGNIAVQGGMNLLGQQAGRMRLNRLVEQAHQPPKGGYIPHPGNLMSPP